MSDPITATNHVLAYETLIHQYLDGRPITPGAGKASATERDRAFFCHPLWDDAPRAALEHELFAVAYARYFQQEAVSNTRLLKRAFTLAPQALMRAIRYAQLFLNLESPRWREVLQLKPEGFGGLRDFIKVQEIINKEYRRLKHEIQGAETGVRTMSAVEFLLYASLYGFQFLLPAYIQIDRQLREAVGTPTSLMPRIEPQLAAEIKAFNQTFELTTRAIRSILTWKLRTRPESELQLSEEMLAEILARHLKPLLSTVPILTYQQVAPLKAVARIIQAHMELQDFIDRSANSYSFDTDFNLILSPCRRYTVLDPTTPQTDAWDSDGRKLKYLETYWFTRAFQQFVSLGLADVAFGREENRDQNQHAALKALQSRMVLAEVYGIPDEVVLERGTRVDTFKALLSSHLTEAFFQLDYIQRFGEYLQQTGHWRISMSLLAMEGMMSGHNRLPLTWATRSEKARALIGWTVCERYPAGDLTTSESILEFWTLDMQAWAARLRADSRAELPELYERPYLRFGEHLVQIPWLGAYRHTTNASINQLRLRGARRAGLRDETQSIEEQLGELLRARGFHVVMNYHPPRRDGEDDAGEVDVICQCDGHLFVIEVKSTYVRKDFREAWQHKYQTLRRAGVQVAKKCVAVAAALQRDSDLSQRLGVRSREALEATHGWIVDTSIEHDHTSFSGYLKVSLEEVMIVLRNERHVLLGLPDATEDTDLYPDGFSAGRFAAVVEGDQLWPHTAGG